MPSTSKKKKTKQTKEKEWDWEIYNKTYQITKREIIILTDFEFRNHLRFIQMQAVKD